MSKNANFWRKYEIILPRKNLPIWDPNLPLRNPKSPYLALRKYHMYEIVSLEDQTSLSSELKEKFKCINNIGKDER